MDKEKDILECWYAGQIPENEFYKLLTKNNNLLQLWHQLIIEKSKKNDTKGESKEEEIQQD